MRERMMLLNIDVQKDFCNGPNNPNYKGTLFVPGAEEDSERTADLIDRGTAQNAWEEIMLTFDQHNLFHVGNQPYWRNANGDSPAPYTNISEQDLISGKWMVSVPAVHDRTVSYLRDLKAAGIDHTIWPAHCLIGTEGACMHSALQKSILNWENSGPNVAVKISKGSNMYVEHFGALHAEVPDPDDVTTKLSFDTGILPAILNPKIDKILIVGQALNFCLKRTVEQMIANCNDPNVFKKFVFLKDCTSPVTAVPNWQQTVSDFWKMVESKGAVVTTSDKIKF